MKIIKRIVGAYSYAFTVKQSGLIAISVSARCKSKKQIKSSVDEDLRVEINGAGFREIPPEKNVQQYNIPCSFNGSQLRGLKKTVTFLTVLEKGEHEIRLIPRGSAFAEEIEIQPWSGTQNPSISINEQAEEGDRRPWHSFVLIDLPLKQIRIAASVQYRWPDSDDIKLIINGEARTQSESTLHRFWVWAGSLLRSVFQRSLATERTFETNLLPGIHYIELYADKTPTLNSVQLDFFETETKAALRARRIVEENANIIKAASKEFGVDPVVVAGVIYQEQAMNVDFIDTLTDYIGGLAGVNTSIGIGQVRVKTAEALERVYPQLYPLAAGKEIVLDNTTRVEFLKNPVMNIRYVAAKIAFEENRWREAGFDMGGRPEILGTLYNIGSIEEPIEPHSIPDANDFGKGVAENYNAIKHWLEL
ncbi:MAG: hypothetical protein Q8P78_02835 [bacterium]|nr:hypothetical protein [bacterium]